MKVIDPCFSFMHLPDGEFMSCGIWNWPPGPVTNPRTRPVPDSARKLLSRIVRLGHDSVLEHISVTVRIVCDRGVTHELVRHRLCSFSQESTRYANYAQDKFGQGDYGHQALFLGTRTTLVTALWLSAMQACEDAYLKSGRRRRHGSGGSEASCPTASRPRS